MDDIKLPPFDVTLRDAEAVVRRSALWKRYIDGTPLSNDIAVWMTVFAQDYARAAVMADREGRWIPCDQGRAMPVQGLDVLIAVNPDGESRRATALAAFVTIGRWNGELSWWSDEDHCSFDVEIVTHWMPMPAPPKEPT